MSRVHLVALLVIAIATTPRAAFSAQDFASNTQVWAQLPVPPAPPGHIPPKPIISGQYQPAPVPNPDLFPPRGQAAQSGAQLTPGLFLPKDRFAGDGYIPGTTVQSEQERRLKPGAGFNLSLPLD
jgi:hypothetical protein